MTAIYKMEQNPPKKGSGKKVVLHPRIVPWDTVSTDRLIEEASSRSTYTSGDLKGAVRLLSDMLKEKLRDGYNVYLDGIGYFSVSLKSRPVEDKKELRSESVHFKNVNFRCCAGLKHELKTMPVERYKEPKVTDFSQEEKSETGVFSGDCCQECFIFSSFLLLPGLWIPGPLSRLPDLSWY